MQPQSPSSPAAQPSEGMPQSTLPEVPLVPAPLPTAPAAADQTQPSPAAAADDTSPAMADDGDLIEKEWVHKVKQIVGATAHDPFEQNKQFTKLKADYMQKRYGKSIKLDE